MMLRYFTRNYFHWLKWGGKKKIYSFAQQLYHHKRAIPTVTLNVNILRCNQLNVVDKRSYSSKVYDENEVDLDGDGLFTVVDSIETEPSKVISFRELLHSESDDPIISKINNFESLQEVNNFINSQQEHNTPQCLSQLVLISWDLIKRQSQSIGVSHYDQMKQLLERINNVYKEMTDDEITCTLLYLTKMGISLSYHTMNNLLDDCMHRIKTKFLEFPLTSLSRFSVTVHSSSEVYTPFIIRDVLPCVLEHMEKCTNQDDFRLITICLNHMHQLIDDDLIETYKQKVEQLIDTGEISNKSVQCILKILNLLNFPYWTQKNSNLIRKLVLLISTEFKTFENRELESIFKIFQSHLEPAGVVESMIQRSNELMSVEPSPELLACAVLKQLPEERAKCIELAKMLLEQQKTGSNTNVLPTLFKILRLLKISDMQICNEYWSQVLQQIKTKDEEKEDYKLAKHCHRYMHFNNNLGGTYRHIKFEKALSKIIMNELKNGISGLIPNRLAKLSSFVLAYGHTENGQNMFPQFIVDKILEMGEQFTILDILSISRGIQIALEMRFRHYIPHDAAQQLVKLESFFNASINKQLQSPDLDINELNMILRSFNNRKGSRNTIIYHKIMDRFEGMKFQMNSRLIRDITFNLVTCGYAVPNICEQFLWYIETNEEFIIGDTVEKVLWCCYNLGHMTENYNALQAASRIVQRDFNYMSGLSIVQAGLALCFYKAVPDRLIERIFNIDFIRRLESEIAMCYSKATYPERVLNQVMQLNRAACLDYPGSEVPWFQQNYIEAQMTKVPVILTQFHVDVKNTLLSIVQDEKLLQTNAVTPYGYRIDFVLHLDKSKSFLPPITDNALINYVDKFAILILKPDSFTENNINQLKGNEFLRRRHLEILGYKVIHIKPTQWNAMYMNVEGAKVSFLKNLLQLET